MLKYFYSGTAKTKYGDRLNGIDKVRITEKQAAKIIANVEKEETITDAKINISGKIIYFIIAFKKDTTMDIAKEKCLPIIEEFSKKEQAFYDFHFTIHRPANDTEKAFVVMGTKKNHNTAIVWNNNTPIQEVTEAVEKTTEER